MLAIAIHGVPTGKYSQRGDDMLTLEQKQQIYFATRTANYLASMRLEGIVLQDEVAVPNAALESASTAISSDPLALEQLDANLSGAKVEC
jgi:hypothetical protein